MATIEELLNTAYNVRTEKTPGGNTAGRVGTLFEDIVKEAKFKELEAFGNLRFSEVNSGSEAISLNLTASVASKIEAPSASMHLLERGKNISQDTGSIVFDVSGSYQILATISLEGQSGNTYAVQLRKNDNLISTANSQVQVPHNSTFNVNTNDIEFFDTGDDLSMYIEDIGGNSTVSIKMAKLVVNRVSKDNPQ